MKKRVAGSVLLIILFVILLSLARVRFQQNQLDAPADKIASITEKNQKLSTASEDNLEEIKSNPAHISKKLSDTLTVDADVTEGTGNYKEYKIELAQLSVADAKETLEQLTGETVEAPESSEGNFWMYAPGGGFAGEVDGVVFFSKNDKADDALFSLLNIWDARNKEKQQDKEIAGMSKQTACGLVLDCVKKVTREECDILHVNAIDESVIDELSKKEGEELDKNQYAGGAYLIYMGLEKDGLPVYSGIGEQYISSVLNWDVAKNCTVEAVVTKNGLRYFNMSYPYNIADTGRKLQILSATEALEKALVPFKNLITEGITVIDNIYLEYVPIASESLWKPQLLRPYWTIEYTNTSITDGVKNTSKDVIRINAETGEDLAYGK